MALESLHGKRILVVDDEPDILDTVLEALDTSKVFCVGNFEEARKLITEESFDLAILDIMGVNGFALLDACRAKRLPAAMLTANAINVESLNLAVKLGAVSFLPKEELERLPEVVAEILEDLDKGHTHWASLFKRLGPFFEKRFGILWEHEEVKNKFPRSFYY